MLKLEEKLIERHVRENFLIERPLHPNQNAYQEGKSCESALHQLVRRIESAMNNQEVALAAFLDIEGAFDHTSFSSMITAVERHGIEDTICRWIKNMLHDRRAQSALLGETMDVSVAKGCPQGGVLSPLLWDLVVDELLVNLNRQGFYTQGYADDLVILVRGKHLPALSGRMQAALKIVEAWCITENLKVNPGKTAETRWVDSTDPL